MKKTLLIILCAATLTLYAQESSKTLEAFLQTYNNVEIYQDTAISLLINNLISENKYMQNHVARGFRVQVYSSNKQREAKKEAMELEQRIIEKLYLPVYIQYTSPMWKVRVGDFLTRSEADEWRDKIVKAFPDLQGNTYVVPDDINQY